MSENKSPNLHFDEFSPDDNILSDNQGKSEELPFGMLGSTTDEECALQTPEQKLGSQAQDTPAYTSKSFLSSVSGNSDISTKEGSEAVSSPSSSSDAESGTYDLPAKNYMLGNDVFPPKAIDLEFDSIEKDENINVAEEDWENIVKEKDGHYEELIGKVAKYEAELKLTKNLLHSSQEEIGKLRYENVNLAEELDDTIEKLRSSEESLENMEKNYKKELEKQQKQYQAQLDVANQSIDRLQVELGSERRFISELQETINKTTNDLNGYTREVEELKLSLQEAIKDFSKDITSLHEQKDDLQSRNNIFEEQIKQYEAEKVLANNRESDMVHEMEQLNKSFDAYKLKYDMLMVEKNGLFAQMQSCAGALIGREAHISQLEERISKLTTQNVELLDESKKVQKVVHDLRLKLSDQEQEMKKQRVVLDDRAEEKREAIRQLCFSLEYYRTGYHELREAFVKHKHPALSVV